MEVVVSELGSLPKEYLSSMDDHPIDSDSASVDTPLTSNVSQTLLDDPSGLKARRKFSYCPHDSRPIATRRNICLSSAHGALAVT